MPADLWVSQRPEQEIDPGVGVGQQIGHPARHGLQRAIAGRDIKHQRGKARLQRKGRPHDARPDGTSVSRESKSDGKDQRHADQAENDMHWRAAPQQ